MKTIFKYYIRTYFSCLVFALMTRSCV